jgi:hypothetical protein
MIHRVDFQDTAQGTAYILLLIRSRTFAYLLKKPEVVEYLWYLRFSAPLGLNLAQPMNRLGILHMNPG